MYLSLRNFQALDWLLYEDRAKFRSYDCFWNSNRERLQGRRGVWVEAYGEGEKNASESIE